MRIDVTFRQSLLKLEMYLQNNRKHQINFSLRNVFLVKYRDHFLTNVTQSIIFYLQGLISAYYEVFFWEIRTFCEISINMTHGKLYSFLLNYFLNFSETGRYTDVLFTIIISNSLSKWLFPEILFFLSQRSIKKISICQQLMPLFIKLN